MIITCFLEIKNQNLLLKNCNADLQKNFINWTARCRKNRQCRELVRTKIHMLDNLGFRCIEKLACIVNLKQKITILEKLPTTLCSESDIFTLDLISSVSLSYCLRNISMKGNIVHLY